MLLNKIVFLIFLFLNFLHLLLKKSQSNQIKIKIQLKFNPIAIIGSVNIVINQIMINNK